MRSTKTFSVVDKDGNVLYQLKDLPINHPSLILVTLPIALESFELNQRVKGTDLVRNIIYIERTR
jgi:hypothetical protein